jgi:hypothetical protein
MKIFLGRRSFFLFACFCGCVLSTSTLRSEPLRQQSKDFAPNSSQASGAALSSEAQAPDYIVVPGPLRSFLRMAGISQEATPEEVLPLFGHFVAAYGYEADQGGPSKATEALILFKRYLEQAITLASVAGPGATLRFSNCEEAKPLLVILGYRLTNGCGSNPSVEVGDPQKAFITVDSGFPLADLEQALLRGQPFSAAYPSVRLPLMYTKRDWTGKENSKDTDVINALADSLPLARLYWALSRVDANTREVLRESGGVRGMVPRAAAIDFYGSTIAIRNGRVDVPGGTSTDGVWGKLVGADPDHPAEFIARLLQKDHGYLAEYYDAMARAPLPQLGYLTRGDHLQRLYAAFHDHDSSDDALRSSFRPGANLLLLVTRLPIGADGEPLVPGDLSVWKQAFQRKPSSKIQREWAQRTRGWTTPDDLVQGLFALTREYSEDGPLDMYMTLSEIDRQRPRGERMQPETVRLLIAHFSELLDQYEVFSEFAGLDDASIAQFVKTTQKIDRVRDPLLRGDMMGIFEANLGLWQVFARQGQIRRADQNESWERTIRPFGEVRNSAQLFDAGRASLAELMKAVTGTPEINQEKIIDLLAGPEQSTDDGRQVHGRMAERIREVLTDQRLVSLDTLLELSNDFAKMEKNPGEVDRKRALGLATELEEARAPRAMFTEAERAEWTPGHEPNRHIILEMKTDAEKLFGEGRPTKNMAAREKLTPFFRDTLVGLNYAYYDPPGAQILHSSPLLVRSHDFLAPESVTKDRAWMAPQLFGIGLTAANGAHLSGSLAGLPYALAQIEQDFIVPKNVQALIWQETTADLLTSSVVPRWWSTSREDLHAAALYQKAGEELILGAAKDATLRTSIVDILSSQLPPETMDQVTDELSAGRGDEALGRIAPADTFYLTAEFQKQFPGRMAASGRAGTELERLLIRNPDEASPERLSEEFGVPHPVLTQSYRDEMLHVKPFPSVMDYASELLAESWESTNLYWARLADEMGYPPVMLNELAPMLTRQMVENIFGSDFDDWPALIRAMRETGAEFRRKQGPGSKTSAALGSVGSAN